MRNVINTLIDIENIMKNNFEMNKDDFISATYQKLFTSENSPMIWILNAFHKANHTLPVFNFGMYLGKTDLNREVYFYIEQQPEKIPTLEEFKKFTDMRVL